jgi:nucleotide-binding universal stress UspA family protein
LLREETMYETILVPTDGSSEADDALEHALELAELCDADVHVLFVADTAQDSVTVVGTDVIDALKREGASVVEAVETRGDSLGIDVEGEILQGDPAKTIVDYARETDVDLIVMGTHGRRGLSRVLLGSVTEAVMRTAPVPVLTVRPDEDEAALRDE